MFRVSQAPSGVTVTRLTIAGKYWMEVESPPPANVLKFTRVYLGSGDEATGDEDVCMMATIQPVGQGVCLLASGISEEDSNMTFIGNFPDCFDEVRELSRLTIEKLEGNSDRS